MENQAVSAKSPRNEFSKINGQQKTSWKPPLQRPAHEGCVYVSKLPANFTKDDVSSLFAKYNVVFVSNVWKRQDMSTSACKVNFASQTDAMDATQEMNGTVIQGNRIKIEIRSPSRAEFNSSSSHTIQNVQSSPQSIISEVNGNNGANKMPSCKDVLFGAIDPEMPLLVIPCLGSKDQPPTLICASSFLPPENKASETTESWD